ncbi:LacI family transcriptional regulator [Rubricella aquisinus]|uniref:LacI family transcriptional regulator n=1 Tax=Rubricella aquisinus TaxID=2028108 RepID=A0A840WRG7_9RHOB|nr:LacI family transcriptional regulator [Rubricella aquisinus]
MTLKELARQLGLSPTTVSRALNGYPEVNAETRVRVEEAARAANYVPNNMAQRLATGRAKAIGHVVPLHDHQIINPFFAEFIAGASESYAQAGFEMILSVVPRDQEEDVYRSLAARHTVDGVIIHNVREVDSRIELLTDLKMPFVVHGRSNVMTEGYTYLDIRNANAFEAATRHLIRLGHRRIGLMNGLIALSFAKRRLMGYTSALENFGLPVDEALIRDGEMTEGYGYDTMMAWLDSDHPPTAVLSSSILSAMGAARALADRGLRLGHDVSIATHDDKLSYIENGTEDAPVFTSTRSSIRAAGTRAAQMLIDMIEHPETPVQSEVWEVDLVYGRSTGPAPRAKD